jgi:hypothetical protein
VIAAARWDSGDAFGEQSAYVPATTAPIQRAGDALKRLSMEQRSLSAHAHAGLWACINAATWERFVEGIARVKKSSAEGRGRMLVDTKAIADALRRHGPLDREWDVRPRNHADDFAKAFYYSREDDVLQWVDEHCHHYPLHVARALVERGIGTALKKPELALLIHKVDKIYEAKWH